MSVRMTEEIKPCPFCGEEAKIFQVGIDANPDSVLNGTFIIGCDGPNGSLCPGYAYGSSPFYTTRELAIRMWNNREHDDGRDT